MSDEDVAIFFLNLKSGAVEEVRSFVDQSSLNTSIYSEKNHSALMVILKQLKSLSAVAAIELEDDEEASDETKNGLAKLFNLYELLISKGFSLGPHEDFDRI